MEQSIERARVANALAQMGVAQIAVSDVERLIWEAEQAADLRRQWAAAQTDRAEVLKAIDIVIAERDASHAEIDALRRQLAECQAAASPALIEEYAKACHYAGERNYAAPDFAVWLRRRLEAQVE